MKNKIISEEQSNEIKENTQIAKVNRDIEKNRAIARKKLNPTIKNAQAKAEEYNKETNNTDRDIVKEDEYTI